MLFLGTTIDGLQLGLCFAVLALGVYLSYSVLDFPDLSVDGTFPLGGVCATILIFRAGMPPLIAILLAFLIGMIAGSVTGLLHVKLKITALLSSIIVMTGLLSVTLALTQLLTENGYTTTIFSYRGADVKSIFDFNGKIGMTKDLLTIAVLLAVVIFVKTVMDLFLKTKLGYLLRATGSNEKVVISLGKDTGNYKILGISVANGFAAMSGAIYSQLFMSYDNSSGSGKVVLALASVIIGMAVFSKIKFIKDSTAVIIGAILYSLCLNYLVLVDTNGIYLKLLNAIMFALILAFNNKISRIFSFVGKKYPKEAKKND